MRARDGQGKCSRAWIPQQGKPLTDNARRLYADIHPGLDRHSVENGLKQTQTAPNI